MVNSVPAREKRSRRSARGLSLRTLTWLGPALLGALASCVTSLEDVEKYRPVEIVVVEPEPICEPGEKQTTTCDDDGRPGEQELTCVEDGFAWEDTSDCICVEGAESLDREMECPGYVPRTLRCQGGLWESLECEDPCAYHEQECGPLRRDETIDCGGCADGQVCLPDTKACESFGDRDPVSGYIWASPAFSSGNQAEAAQACEQLVVGNATNFRLPTISELRSLVGDCPDVLPGGICRVTDTCSATSCWVGENCMCHNGGTREDGCYGGAIYDELIGNNPPFCDVLWSGTPAPPDDFWLISFDGLLNHREKTYSAKALCIYADP